MRYSLLVSREFHILMDFHVKYGRKPLLNPRKSPQNDRKWSQKSFHTFSKPNKGVKHKITDFLTDFLSKNTQFWTYLGEMGALSKLNFSHIKIVGGKTSNFLLFIHELFMRREVGLVISLPFPCQLAPKICGGEIVSPLCGEIHEFSIALRSSTFKKWSQ